MSTSGSIAFLKKVMGKQEHGRLQGGSLKQNKERMQPLLQQLTNNIVRKLADSTWKSNSMALRKVTLSTVRIFYSSTGDLHVNGMLSNTTTNAHAVSPRIPVIKQNRS